LIESLYLSWENKAFLGFCLDWFLQDIF